MKVIKLPCWKLEDYHENVVDDIYISCADGPYGHEFLSCLKCGQLYSADISTQMYRGPALNEALMKIHCIKCKTILSESAHPYPDKYLSVNGKIISYNTENINYSFLDPIKPLIIDLPEIYSDFYPDTYKNR